MDSCDLNYNQQQYLLLIAVGTTTNESTTRITKKKQQQKSTTVVREEDLDYPFECSDVSSKEGTDMIKKKELWQVRRKGIYKIVIFFLFLNC